MELDVAWWILWSFLGGATVEANLYATFGLRSFSLKHLISGQTFKISFIFDSLGGRSPWAENSIITKVAWPLKSNVPPVGGANSEFFVLVLHFCADCRPEKPEAKKKRIWNLVLIKMISFLYGAIIDITQELLRILFGSLILAFAVNSKYYYIMIMVLSMQ